MDPTDLPAKLSPNRCAKRTWVWNWLDQLPMHWGFKDSESSDGSGSSDDGESHAGDTKVAKGEQEPDQGVSVAETGSEKAPVSGLVRRAKKRRFVEEADEVVDLMRHYEVRALEGVRERLVKRFATDKRMAGR